MGYPLFLRPGGSPTRVLHFPVVFSTRAAPCRAAFSSRSVAAPPCRSRLQEVVATYSNNQVSFSSRDSSLPFSPFSHSFHSCTRQAANMSANVGLRLWVYHGLCRCACGPSRPPSAYHNTTTEPTNQA